MKSKPSNPIDIDDLQDIGKYMFSIANGNHILRYSELEYRDFLVQNPTGLIEMLIIYHASMNWGYDDTRMFENYDEQWLAQKIDPDFHSELDFSLPDFRYENLQPYQQVVIDFTRELIETAKDFAACMQTGTPQEQVYAVVANNLDVDPATGAILHPQYVIQRGLEMYRYIFEKGNGPENPFQDWELTIY